jgi:small GTP-binding protein
MSKREKYSEYKIIVLGAHAVGKSSLVVRFLRNAFVGEIDPAIEDSYRKMVTLPDGDEVLLDILDTTSQEEFSAMRDRYLRAGQAFVFDFGSREF